MMPLRRVMLTPEIEVWEICTFEMIRQKSAYLTEYLNYYWTDLHQRFSFKFHDFRSFGILGFRNGLGYYNFNLAR